MKLLNQIVLLMFLLGTVVSLNAQEVVAKPKEQHLVNDFANVLSNQQEQALENKLLNFFANTSTQIAVVTVTDLNGSDAASYAFELGEKWGVGDAKFNNGIVVLVKPKTSTSNGQVFIAPGYGLEGVVPDAIAKQIVDVEMIPAFKQGNLFEGVDRATNVLIDLTKGEYNYQQYAEANKRGGSGAGIIPIIIMVVLFSIFGRNRRRFSSYGNRSSLPFWLALGMMSGNRHNHSGMFNDFSSGSGSFGGGSNFGSFGGFGGGSFGGGGAGGSW